jgi:hypothetical protein
MKTYVQTEGYVRFGLTVAFLAVESTNKGRPPTFSAYYFD